jgi:transposase
MRKFINIDRETPMLLPHDLREWVPEDDMVHFIIESVEGMKLQRFKINERGTGSRQYPPEIMLELLIYCYANGIFSSRRIERATYRDIAVRYLTADTHPDHDTIATFRRENFEAVAECFVGVLELARALKLLKVGTVSVDGTKVKANASKYKNVSYERAGQIYEQFETEVKELLKKAEEADSREQEDGQTLPKEIAHRENLRQKMEAACREIEERARERAKAERAEYECKVAARENRHGKCKGKEIKPPEEEPKGTEQVNVVDKDSRLMKKNKRSGYEQCYNAQAVVDADGAQLVLGARITQCASDSNELEKDIKAVPESVGKVERVLADSGYVNEKQVQALEGDEIDVYMATGTESKQCGRKYDYRPEKAAKGEARAVKAQWLKRMKAKLETETGRALYARRKQTVEPVFGIIKHCMGFRQFLLRGLKKVAGEWQLVMTAYNFKRLWNLKMATA